MTLLPHSFAQFIVMMMIPLASSWSTLVRTSHRRISSVRRLAAQSQSTSVPIHRALAPVKVLHKWDFELDHDLSQPWRDINRVFCCTGVVESGELSIKQEDGSVITAGFYDVPNIEKLLKAAVTSKFGRGTETVLDETVRKGTELGPDILKLGDAHDANSTKKEVKRVMKEVQETIKSKLFPNAESISLEFCKLALYQKGGHFLEHRDTVHAPNHQGTLLVEVRSKHKGGKLTFSAVDGTTVHWHLDEPPSEPSLVRWCAFHTDVVHKVEPVLSGVRAVLQFDILVKTGHKPAVVDEDEKDEEDDEDDDPKHKLNTFDYHLLPLKEDKNSRAGAVTTAGITNFIKKLQPYVREQSIALPLFHSYQQAYVRPEFLKSADRALFDALLKAGHSIILTPIAVIGHTDYSDGYNWKIGPCDQYDRIYSADVDDKGEMKIVHKSADKVNVHKVTYVCTKHQQLDEYYSTECSHVGNEPGTEEMRYFSAAMVILKKEAEKKANREEQK